MTDRRRTSRLGRPVAWLLLAAGLASPARGERPLLADELPAELQGVGIVEHLDEALPLDLVFADSEGDSVTLGDYFAGEKPVILTLNYYRCPMLCNLTLNGVVTALAEIDWSVGEEFDIVTVSIAPDEGPELAQVKKRVYVSQYDRPTGAGGWAFLTGEQAEIEALALATGFGYRKDEKTGDYAHTSSIMFVTPDGRLSRYMNEVMFDPKDVRLALIEASRGAIGSPMEKFLLFMCYRYDPEANSYAMSAWKLMRLAGVVTVLAIGVGVFVLWRRGPSAGGLGS
jgi:protein SCO1/2